MPQFRFGAFDVALLALGVLTAGGVLAEGGVLAGGDIALLDGGVARVLLSSLDGSLPLPCGRWWKMRL